MAVRRNQIYIFTKSGNRVRAIEPTTYGGRGNWRVSRVDGASIGKEMIVAGTSLTKEGLNENEAS